MPRFNNIHSYSPSLQKSILEGMFASLMFGGGMLFIVPFAVFLGANSMQIGFLNAFPALLAAWLQLGAIKLLEVYKKRKSIIIITVFLQSLSWLLIALIPFIFPAEQIFWLIVITTIGTVIGSIGGPLWQSWMRSLTPKEILGEYFGMRNALTGLVVFLTTLGAGLLLEFITPSLMLYAFSAIFIVSFIGRLFSSIMFTKMDEPEVVVDNTDNTNLMMFVNQLGKDNFGFFILFGTLMTFGISLVGPFFSLYLLNGLNLKTDYLLYTLIISAASAASLLSMPYWGKVIDRFGTIKALKAVGLLAAFFPLTLILVRDPYLLIVVELLDGVIFSGFNLCLASFIYESVAPEKIIKYASFQAVLFGTATFCGTILSGYVQTFDLSIGILTTPFYVVCGVAILFRLMVYFGLIRKIKDVRKTRSIRQEKLVLSVLTFEPVRESIHDNAVILFYGTKDGLSKATKNTLKTIKIVEQIGEKRGRIVANDVKKTAKRVTYITKEGLEVVEYVAEGGFNKIKRITTNGFRRAKNHFKKGKENQF